MPEHKIGNRGEWQAARDELAILEAEQAECLAEALADTVRRVLSSVSTRRDRQNGPCSTGASRRFRYGLRRALCGSARAE